jgi:hypothetical protein
MGKRSKLFKTGKNKAYNTVMKARRKTKLAVVLPHLKEKHSLEIKIQPKKLIDDKPIKLRHRRVKDRSILSKGQQRRKLKKLKHEIRKSIPNKVLKQEKSDEPKKKEAIPFNLIDVDNTLMDVFEENKKKNDKKPVKLSKKDIL